MPPVQSTDKTLSRAKQATKAGNWLAALDLYQSVLRRFPKNKRAQQGLAALKPQALPTLLQSAQQAQTAGQWAEATEQLQAAATLAPDMLTALHLIAGTDRLAHIPERLQPDLPADLTAVAPPIPRML